MMNMMDKVKCMMEVIKKGFANGKGTQYNKNGDIVYEGDFVNGVKEGNGKHFYDDGTYYIGRFKNGVSHGKGIQYNKDGKILLFC